MIIGAHILTTSRCCKSFKEYEDAMATIDHLWSLPMGSQIRIVKMSVDAHGRAEISNLWVRRDRSRR